MTACWKIDNRLPTWLENSYPVFTVRPNTTPKIKLVKLKTMYYD